MPRSSRTGQLQYYPEIEKTAKKLRKETRLRKNKVVSSTSVQSTTTTESIASCWDSEKEQTMAENQVVAEEQRTLRELSAPNLNQQPLCIQHPALEVGFELRSGLIQLLPTFRGLENEDPHKHLKEFHMVCSSFKPQRVTEDQIKLHAFPFSLADRAKDWLFYLPSGSINTWDEMVRLFLEKFFPASRADSIRRENMWHQRKRYRDSPRVLGTLQATVCKLPSTWSF